MATTNLEAAKKAESSRNESGDLPVGHLHDKKRELHHAHSSIEQCLLHTTKGILLGFFGFTIPVSLRQRKFGGGRKGAALASLLGSFRALDCLLWRIRHKLEKEGRSSVLLSIIKKYATGIAGGLSIVPVIFIDKPAILNSTMILWLLVRALRSLVPSVPYGAVAIMSLSASQILSTWIIAPDELSPSYIKFLNVQGGKPISILNKFREGLVPTTCITHEGIGCTKHAFIFFLQGLRRALPLYIPIHLLGFYFSRKKDVSITLINLVRSCAFLSGYCTIAWLSACLYFRAFPGVNRLGLILCLWAPGLATAIEREGRQKELAAYCLTHALDSIYLFLKKRKLVKPNDFIGSLAVIYAFATIMHHHHHQPDFISRLLFGIGMKNPI